MQETESLKQVPLHQKHVALGAKIVPFAGFEMPVQYSGIIEEHMAVRQQAGLFDVSHMGEVMVTGETAFDFVQQLITNDASKLYDGKALYTVMCNHDGFAIDDLLIYRFNAEKYMIVVNASNIEKDFSWMQANNPMNATLTNFSDEASLLAIQGPKAFEIVQKLTSINLEDIRYYHFISPKPAEFLNLEHIVLSHTGYTGEKGLEIYCSNQDVEKIWDALMDAGTDLGLVPCGLGARDTLRLESGYCLYGHELTEDIMPLEAGLGWVTKLDKESFIGKNALQTLKDNGIERKLIAFVMEERGIPREGYPIFDLEENEIGFVTSGTQSPILNTGIGMGFVKNNVSLTTPDSKILIGVRNKKLKATVKKAPLHK